MSRNLILTLLVVCVSQFAVGQTEIYGSWNVHCSIEQTNNKTVRMCNLCPTITTDSSVTVEGFTLEVDSTTLHFGGSKEGISYIKRPSGKAITFVKDRTPYSFDILTTTSSDHVILKSKDGMVLILQRKPKK